MEQVEQLAKQFIKNIEYSFVLGRQRIRNAKESTFEDLHLAHQLYKTIGEDCIPHLLYQFASHVNDCAWLTIYESIITSEEYSEAFKIQYMEDMGDEYDDYVCEVWRSYKDKSVDELRKIIWKFEENEGKHWDVNSAARGLIDNLLVASFHHRDALLKSIDKD